MVTTWQLRGIRSVDPGTMEVAVTELVDGVETRAFSKTFSKSLTSAQILNQLALFIKQKRQQALDKRLPFNTLDLSDFETRIQNA